MAVLACEAKALECQIDDVTLDCKSSNNVLGHSYARQDCLLQPVLHGYTRTSAPSCSCIFMIPLMTRYNNARAVKYKVAVKDSTEE